MTWSLIQPKKEDRISSGDGGCRQNREKGKGGWAKFEKGGLANIVRSL